MNKNLTSDFKEMFKAVEELPVVSGDMVQAASYLLYIVANYITRSSWEQKLRQEKLMKQELLLSEEQENRKRLEEQLEQREQISIYSMSKESDLMEMIHDGREEAALNLLQDITNDIILENEGSKDVICTKAIELIVLTSRIAVKHGISQDRVSKINTSYMRLLLMQDSVEDICFQLREAILLYLKEIRERKIKPEPESIRIMKQYMKENFHNNLTLDMIADAAFLSASYASRLFKKEQDVSIMEFLMQIRMTEARRLLKETDLSIEVISERTGYSDPGYFTKVFRKSEGKTPSQYRQTHKS